MKKRFVLSGALVLLLILVASAALVSADHPAARLVTQTDATLEGPRWILVSYAAEDGKTTQALPDVEATAQFEDGRVSGSAGCNRFSAPYEAEASKLKIGMTASTMMMCESSVMEQESAYLANLLDAASYKIAGDLLAIANAKGDTVLTFRAEEPISLTDGAWVMTSYNNGKGGVVSALADAEVTAVFADNGKVGGSAGCNTYIAPYAVDGNKIQIGAAATTRRLCPQPIMDQETQYLAAIRTAATYNIEGRLLELRSATDALLASYSHQPAAEAQPAAAAPLAKATQGLQGTYLTIRPSASGEAATIALRLNPDGKAEYATSFGKGSPVVQTGAWTDNGDGTVTVTLTEKGGQMMLEPVVIKFEQEGAYLTAVEYDKAIYGEQGLKLNLAADVARKVGAALVTLDLAAGFPLDPTFVSVNGGGEVDASLLGQGCQGFINRHPVVTVNWAGKSDFVRAFFYSDTDATLVVLTPDGKLVCNNNANEQLLDPVVEMKNPVAGTYRIWVGSTARRQLIPGILVLTSKPDVNLDTFDPGKLITRPKMPVALPKPAPRVAAEVVQKALDAALKTAPELKPGAPLTSDVTAEGDIPLFEFPVTKTCAGLVKAKPSFEFVVSGQPEQVRTFFEGDADATLLVLGDGGKIVECNDDAQADANRNPMIELKNPPAGAYLVFVGRLSPDQPVKGTLTVTDAADAEPAVLAPAKQ